MKSSKKEIRKPSKSICRQLHKDQLVNELNHRLISVQENLPNGAARQSGVHSRKSACFAKHRRATQAGRVLSRDS